MLGKTDHLTQVRELQNVHTQPEPRYDDDPFADPDGHSKYPQADFEKDAHHDLNFQENTGYIPLSGSHSDVPKPPPKRYNGKTIWLSVVSLAWCVAAMVLLYLNISVRELGGSAWCPSGWCSGIPSRNATQSPTQIQADLDRRNHDFIAALQFLAKAMEIWFVFIAAGFVWLMTISLAQTDQGLPLVYLLTYIEFADSLKLLDPNLWTAYHATDKRQHRVKVFLYVALVALSCILCNLMGPSVAVLMIPTLQYRESPQSFDTRFDEMLSYKTPTKFSGCTATQMAAKNYSCTYSIHAYALDSLSSFIAAQEIQNNELPDDLTLRNRVPASTQEWLLSMRFNNSVPSSSRDGASPLWAPNRQVLQELSRDFQDYYNSSDNQNSYYGRHSNSLSLSLRRQGPVLGFNYTTSAGPLSITTITPDKKTRCHPFYYNNRLPLAKCFQEGPGWQNGTPVLFFSTNSLTDETGFETAAYYSNRATIVNSTFSGTDYPACFPKGQLNDTQDCDYDSLFSGQFPNDIKLPANITSEMFGELSNAFVVEQYSVKDAALVFIQEAWFKSGIALYATQISNASFSSTFGEVDIDTFPTDLQPVVVDPSWFLAAWSVDSNGTVMPSRSSSRIIQNNFRKIYNTAKQTSSDDVEVWGSYAAFYWSQINLNAFLYMASTLTWSATDVSHAATTDKDILLYNNVMRQVWTFGIFSRTTYLGISVLSCGIILVLAKVCMAAMLRTGHPSSLSVLAAALRQRPPAKTEKEALKAMRIAIHENKDGRLDLRPKR